MIKKNLSLVFALLLVLTVLPGHALAETRFQTYQEAVLQETNAYHAGNKLTLDPWLCALAGVLAVEHGGEGSVGAYRPNGEKWVTIFQEYGYQAVPASSGCNWLRTKEKPTAQTIVAYWMQTPGFQENVRSSMYTHTGVFVYQPARSRYYYVVQLFTVPQKGQTATLPEAPLAIVAGSGVNIRSGPGTGYRRLGKLSRGQLLALQEIQGDWAAFTLEDGQKAYAHMDYLALATEPVETTLDVPSTDPGSMGEAQATGRINVRSGPGMSYETLGQLKRGQRVAVWDIQGKWAQITWTGSQRGYVYLDYLRFAGR